MLSLSLFGCLVRCAIGNELMLQNSAVLCSIRRYSRVTSKVRQTLPVFIFDISADR